jgi:uncharacterized protein
MQIPVSYKKQKQQLWLSAERCIFWEEEKSLIVSDLHFGKTGHFRKSGIAVPQSIFKEDLQRLITQIQHFQPKHLIVVGDFFHSHANKELELFQKWRDDFSHISIHLVKGNHDILHNDWYSSCDIKLKEKEMNVSEFTFIHDITSRISVKEERSAINYYFSGHIHPGIRLSGAGKQSLYFPCFYFGKEYAVLPAFSHFTGVALIDPEEDENVFAIVKNKLVQLQ